MSDDFAAAIRVYIQQALRQIRLPQKGLVTSYDPKTHMAKVMLQPQGVETGWLQVSTLGVGNGFGLMMGLKKDDEVVVHFDSGDLDSGVVSACTFNGKDRPVKTQPGEFKLVHESGSYLKFFKDGTVEVHAKGDSGTLKVMAETRLLLTSDTKLTLNAPTIETFTNNGVSGPYQAGLNTETSDS